MAWGTLPAGRGVPGRLPAALGVRGLHAGARLVTRTDGVENSFFFGNYLCEAACLRIFAATAARRIHPATDAAGGASSGPCERVNPQLTGRRILEVAPYGYNLYPNPHESTAFSHATGPDPVAVRDRSGFFAHVIVERNGQHRSPIRDRTTGLGQRGGERREGNSGCAPGAANPVAAAGPRCGRHGGSHPP